MTPESRLKAPQAKLVVSQFPGDSADLPLQWVDHSAKLGLLHVVD